MTIASIKFYELAKELQKKKGRIVYRGDCAKDEYGAAAVYEELGANPTSVQGLNACLAYGSLPGNLRPQTPSRPMCKQRSNLSIKPGLSYPPN